MQMEPDDLLKQATNKKRAGDLESAIRLLREAYKEISKSLVDYTVETFLRLPAYLQEAGKGDEAWRELNNLIAAGYPNQSKNPLITPIDHSRIYDAMRLFLQREGKSESAVKFGLLSYVCGGLALYRQGHSTDPDEFFLQERRERLRTDFSRDKIELTVNKLLKKAGKEQLREKVSSIVEKYVNKLPNIKLGELAQEIDEAILK
jgi:hypothetical protein